MYATFLDIMLFCSLSCSNVISTAHCGFARYTVARMLLGCFHLLPYELGPNQPLASTTLALLMGSECSMGISMLQGLGKACQVYKQLLPQS